MPTPVTTAEIILEQIRVILSTAGATDAARKNPVRVATAAALPTVDATATTLTGNANGALPAIDGVTLNAADRLLVKDQVDAGDNGLYVVSVVGDGSTKFLLTRSEDANESSDVISGIDFWVTEGTTNKGLWRLLTADPITLGTTDLSFGLGPTGTAGGSLAGTYPNPTLTAAGVAGHKITREVPTGLINGSNTSYALANTPVAGTEEVFYHGLLLTRVTDYTISGGTITMVVAPATAPFVVSYFK